MNRLERIINLKLNNFEIKLPKEDMIEPTHVVNQVMLLMVQK